MSLFRPPPLQTATAGADLSSTPEYTLLKTDGEGELEVATANTDKIHGVLHEGNTENGSIRYWPLTPGYILRCIASTTIAAEAELSATTAGEAVTNDGTKDDIVFGIAETAGGSGGSDIISFRPYTLREVG